jgi:hypothetical protein
MDSSTKNISWEDFTLLWWVTVVFMVNGWGYATGNERSNFRNKPGVQITGLAALSVS